MNQPIAPNAISFDDISVIIFMLILVAYVLYNAGLSNALSDWRKPMRMYRQADALKETSTDEDKTD